LFTHMHTSPPSTLLPVDDYSLRDSTLLLLITAGAFALFSQLACAQC